MKLSDPRLFRQYAYIGGKWTHGDEGREEAVVNPANGEVIGHIPLLEPEQIRASVDVADEAYVCINGGGTKVTPNASYVIEGGAVTME